MQRGQNSRTAGAVSYGVGFFGLVNIMQPQNCTTRLRRLVWTSFFLCVVFLFHFVWFFFFKIFHHVGGVDRKRSAFFLLHLNTTKLFLCVCQVHFFGWWFVFCFFFASFHFDVCADLPPGRHTMILYCEIIRQQAYVQSLKRDIWTHVVWGWGGEHVATTLLEPDCTE